MSIIAALEATYISMRRFGKLLGSSFKNPMYVNSGKNNLAFDAWGRPKSVSDVSLLHGMFTFDVPVDKWYEKLNGTELVTFNNATSVNGALNLTSGLTATDRVTLRTFRHPRYEPNRGHLYSSSIILPNPTRNGIRRFGNFTEESGEFFELRSDGLYGVIRTTVNGVTSDDDYLLKTNGIDLSKGNIFDIQKQWRGVGNYKFFINLEEIREVIYLGKLDRLSSFNPALPIAFECINNTEEVVIQCGCVDTTTEGGNNEGSSYGSVGIENNEGQVSIPGNGSYNTPIVAIRSKLQYNGLINTRDTLALLASAYSDQRCIFRVWATRDFTAITENQQTWQDFRDGHLEYIGYDVPDVPDQGRMDFDPTKATLVFSCRTDQDTTYATSALFEGRTDVWLTPGDMFVFTMHRETGGGAEAGVTFEFAEQI